MGYSYLVTHPGTNLTKQGLTLLNSTWYLGGWPNTNTPCCNNIFFFFFPSFFKAILSTAELPSLCNAVSSIYQLFVPHFAMVVFMCIYLHYLINEQRDTSFEFSSILSTVDLSIHLITVWNIRKFMASQAWQKWVELKITYRVSVIDMWDWEVTVRDWKITTWD